MVFGSWNMRRWLVFGRRLVAKRDATAGFLGLVWVWKAETELSLTQGCFQFLRLLLGGIDLGLRPMASAWRCMSSIISSKDGSGLFFS